MEQLSFGKWLFLQGRHKNTVALHLKKIKVLRKNTKELNLLEVQNFLAEMKQRGYRNATLNHYIGTIKLYGRYRKTNEFESLKFYKKQEAYKSTLSDEEIENLINLPKPKNANKRTWELWSLWFEVLAYTGARPGEVSLLKIDNIDFGRNTISFKHTKTGKPRSVALSPRLAKRLKKHIKACDDFLFITKKGNVFSDHAWLHAFHKRIKLMGIKRSGLTPMSLRHSFATRMLEKDVNIHKIAKIMGHDIKMTQQYEHLTTEDIQRAMGKHPLIKKQINFSKPEIVKIITECLNDIGLSYNLSDKSSGITLEIKCQN